MLKGQVTQSTGSWYKVQLLDGEKLDCRIKGKFRVKNVIKSTNPIAVGDYVDISRDLEEGIGIIEKLYERSNFLVRESPRKKNARHILATNLDQVILVMTLKSPELKLGFLDRMLVGCELYQIPGVIVFNKMDIYDEEELAIIDDFCSIYEHIGYQTLKVSALEEDRLANFRTLLKDKSSLIVGHSGVGKSTLAAAIDPSLDLKTQVLSDYTGKGQHTTTFATMYHLPFGGNLIDSPGIKELSLLDVHPEQVCDLFPEMRDRMHDCKFNDCMHLEEPGCAVTQALSEEKIADFRYDNYFYIVEQLKERNYWEI